MTDLLPSVRSTVLVFLALSLASCASSSPGEPAGAPEPEATTTSTTPPDPDPRVGLAAGEMDAGEAIWNMRLLSNTPSPEPYSEATHSDLAFTGDYAIQGNYNGFLIWDISNPEDPVLRKEIFCPSSQNDVSVYGDLLFTSSEGLNGRVDCGAQGVADSVSTERMRGVRIFDISDIDDPVQVANVQTCRGSHTHTLLVDPDDSENVYVYVSGSASVRSPDELEGCTTGMPEENPETALFRIEVIRVPLDRPEDAAIVSSPRIFDDLEAPPEHGETEVDRRAREERLAQAREQGAFIVEIEGQDRVLPSGFVNPMLDSVAVARDGSGPPTGADSAALREALPGIIAEMLGEDAEQPEHGPTQCHDITVYPAIGLAGGACGGYGLLLDISDPAHPVRIDAVADSNFSYWHSATFNNEGTALLFTDEWGGGGQPKCRESDPEEWGANAIFTLDDREMQFESYYKLPAPQTSLENCVAHNGSLVPVPGRDIKVQGWYQGGISVFDWTDPENPREIAFFDRGPLNPNEMVSAGSWSVYWYNGVIVSSEIARGLDILRLTPSGFLTRNEIDAARTVHFDQLNVQGQPKITWPPSFALARAYLDQLERSDGMSAERVRDARQALSAAERNSGEERRETLTGLAERLEDEARRADDREKVRALAEAVVDLAETVE